MQTSKQTLDQWLTILETRHSQEIQLGLDRIAEVAKTMQLLSPKCTVVTVAGTNGKGSTVATLESIYKTAGYKVGSYTSPHLHRFNERICVNSNPISDEDLCLAFSMVEKARGNTILTYFEVATLSALWYFSNQDLDVMVLEVGMGGRFDAVNILDADVSIITTIDFDHQAFLGDTLEEIGYEKAGIMRSDRPCIYADSNPPFSIIREAVSKNTPLLIYDNDYQVVNKLDIWIWKYGQSVWQLPKPTVNLKSAAAALMAAWLLLERLPMDFDKILPKAMQDVFIPGRLELIRDDVNILYDVSHNPQGASHLASHIQSINTNGTVHAIFSALADKDVKGLISPMRACVDCWYPAQLENKRAASGQDINSVFVDLDIDINVFYEDPWQAFTKALTCANPGDLIVIYGSFLTVAAIREQAQQKEKK